MEDIEALFDDGQVLGAFLAAVEAGEVVTIGVDEMCFEDSGDTMVGRHDDVALFCHFGE